MRLASDPAHGRWPLARRPWDTPLRRCRAADPRRGCRLEIARGAGPGEPARGARRRGPHDPDRVGGGGGGDPCGCPRAHSGPPRRWPPGRCLALSARRRRSVAAARHRDGLAQRGSRARHTRTRRPCRSTRCSPPPGKPERASSRSTNSYAAPFAPSSSNSAPATLQHPTPDATAIGQFAPTLIASCSETAGDPPTPSGPDSIEPRLAHPSGRPEGRREDDRARGCSDASKTLAVPGARRVSEQTADVARRRRTGVRWV